MLQTELVYYNLNNFDNFILHLVEYTDEFIHPSARSEGVTWVTSDGKLWLFGGRGLQQGSIEEYVILADLWSFNTTTYHWTYHSGSLDQLHRDEAESSIRPYSKSLSHSWIYKGQLCMFGGTFRKTDCKNFLGIFLIN